eukprot:TRINITY_DN1409_c0_g1_i1.p1 TRINITY_DN1409_c0_g1~~TRINITY_DN1409_c0_g1_i1.p1  ORF type:complete len:125 (+),score=23.50 TRINITY_DN1409_c0_g1_i1:139-513(+)
MIYRVVDGRMEGFYHPMKEEDYLLVLTGGENVVIHFVDENSTISHRVGEALQSLGRKYKHIKFHYLTGRMEFLKEMTQIKETPALAVFIKGGLVDRILLKSHPVVSSEDFFKELDNRLKVIGLV